MIDKEFRK